MDHHLNEQDLAIRLRLSVRTLQRWRWRGKGPAFLKLGNHRVVYRLSDVEAWEVANRHPGQVGLPDRA
ncbi:MULTISPECIES: helix-turn-helix domain-containing protein [Alphaproteobacteria]|uniref:Helix-turn-helix domain-containing protein n=1 Tax=Bauldia litoralis TaxID=665467 RepID=A0A1G6ENH8_9HYPH|nr:helix-turn-helix domain-containing protein [Bauldia litoralis]SDB59049.1 Helix-turn-helix domain-containing protein [Bauldia litoralis]